MKFIDEVNIYVKAGDGGPGCVSFRREKFIPRGGPDGGDGGDGGSIIIKGNQGLNTLIELKYRTRYYAKNGDRGRGKNQHGRNGSDRLIEVPLGTTVRDLEADQIIADILKDGQSTIVAKGGRGGFGNTHFASPTNQAPRTAGKGAKCEGRWLKLELKLLAQVGLIGLPNAGKSTLLGKLSSAKARVADYPFTTLTPQLGIVRYEDYKSFSIADIPGLVEGSHHGLGLGLRFLKHVERTQLFLFILDASDMAPQRPEDAYNTLRNELKSYNPSLMDKKYIVALNKIDLESAREEYSRSAGFFEKLGAPILPISALKGDGLKELVNDIGKRLE